MSAAACKVIICSNRIAAEIPDQPLILADLSSLSTIADSGHASAEWVEESANLVSVFPGAESKGLESWAEKLAEHLDLLFAPGA